MATFDGKTYQPDLDGERLNTLLERVWAYMSDGEWRTLAEISKATNGTEASVNARLRDFRKARNGRFVVEHERVAGAKGLWRYRVPKGQVAVPYDPDGQPDDDEVDADPEEPSAAELRVALNELRDILSLPEVRAIRKATGAKYSPTFVKMSKWLAEKAGIEPKS